MNAADIKRQILESSEHTGIRKQLVSGDAGLNSNDIIEMGNALESMTKTKGWYYVEAYVLKHANLITQLFEPEDPIRKGGSQALVLLIQYVEQTIRAKNDLLKEQNA